MYMKPAVQSSTYIKNLLSWGDMYVIEYDNPSNEIPALLLVLAIDAANCSQNNG